MKKTAELTNKVLATLHFSIRKISYSFLLSPFRRLRTHKAVSGFQSTASIKNFVLCGISVQDNQREVTRSFSLFISWGPFQHSCRVYHFTSAVCVLLICYFSATISAYLLDEELPYQLYDQYMFSSRSVSNILNSHLNIAPVDGHFSPAHFKNIKKF